MEASETPQQVYFPKSKDYRQISDPTVVCGIWVIMKITNKVEKTLNLETEPCQPPPPFSTIGSRKWLLATYIRDNYQRHLSKQKPLISKKVETTNTIQVNDRKITLGLSKLEINKVSSGISRSTEWRMRNARREQNGEEAAATKRRKHTIRSCGGSMSDLVRANFCPEAHLKLPKNF